MAVGIFNCLTSGTSIICDVTRVGRCFSSSAFVCKFQSGRLISVYINKTLHGTLTDRTMEIISLKKSVLACSKILILEVYSLPGSLLNNNKYRIKLQTKL